MVDMALIQGTLTGLKAASDIARGLIDMKSMADVQGKVIELQSTILSAQSSAMSALAAQTEMAEEIRALRAEIAAAKRWEQERTRYQMVAPFEGGVLFGLRESQANGEPPHWLCTQCYGEGRKSIVNQSKDAGGWISYVCPKCKSSVPTGYRGVGPATYAPD